MPKKPILKELLLLSAIVFVCLLCEWILVPVLLGNSALDINLHDTYYTSPLHNSLWIIIPLICFAFYLFRAIRNGFTNIIVLSALMFSTLCIIGWLSITLQSFNPYYIAEQLSKQLAAEQTANKATVTGLFYGGDTKVSGHYLFTVLQIALALFVGFVGIRIGMNIKRSSTEDKS